MGIIGLLAILGLHPSSYAASIHAICLLVTFISVALTVLYGGLTTSGGEMVWAFLSPLFALNGLSLRAARFWLVIFLVSGIAGAILPRWIPDPYSIPNPELILVFAATLLVVSLFIYLILIYFIRQFVHVAPVVRHVAVITFPT